MRANQVAEAVNAELSRLGVRYLDATTPDGLVSRVEAGAMTEAGGPVLRMGGGWFSGLYDGRALLAYLRELAPSEERTGADVPTDKELFWATGQFWDDVRPLEIDEAPVPAKGGWR